MEVAPHDERMADFPTFPPPPSAGSPFAAIEAYRRTRLRMVLDGAIEPGMSSDALFFCHVLPLNGLDASLRLRDAGELLDAALWPPGGYCVESRFNADGYLVFSRDAGVAIDAHVQWFRFGGLEACGARLVQSDGEERSAVREATGRGARDGAGRIAQCAVRAVGGQLLAHFFTRALPNAIEVLRGSFSITSPLAIAATLVGMRGVSITDAIGFRPMGHGVDRDLVMTPWVVLAPGEDPTAAADEVADCVWQSAGHARMPHNADL